MTEQRTDPCSTPQSGREFKCSKFEIICGPNRAYGDDSIVVSTVLQFAELTYNEGWYCYDDIHVVYWWKDNIKSNWICLFTNPILVCYYLNKICLNYYMVILIWLLFSIDHLSKWCLTFPKIFATIRVRYFGFLGVSYPCIIGSRVHIQVWHINYWMLKVALV